MRSRPRNCGAANATRACSSATSTAGRSGLIALSASRHGYAEEALQRGDAATARERIAALRDIFPGRFYLELQHHLRPEDARLVLAQLRLAEDLNAPYVATNGAAYARPEDALLCDVLTCIKYKTNLPKAGTLLLPNHEFYLKSPSQMARIFAPYPKALDNTLAIAERCRFRLDKLAGQFPLFPVPPTESSTHSYLRTLVDRGAKKRYGNPLPTKVERQLEYELGIIARLDLAGYFLVVWDIAHKAEELGVLAQGRGSAANSAVCYALGITAVDPVGMNLLFERFLSEERNEVPDIDIDFAHQDREKVIQYVYERYGREHAAMTAETITYRTRSAIRDVGKALGLSLAQVDAISKEYDARESLAGAMGTDESAESNALPASVLRRRDLDTGSNLRVSRVEAGGGDGSAAARGPVGTAGDFPIHGEIAAAPLGAPAPPALRSKSELPPRPRAAAEPSQPSGDSRGRGEATNARPLSAKPGDYYGFSARDFGVDPEPNVRGPVGGKVGALLLALCRRVDGFPRHMGIHSGGMVITRDPLVQVAPVEWATMRDRTIVQWDKDDLSDLGLIKIDLWAWGCSRCCAMRFPYIGGVTGRRSPRCRWRAFRRTIRRPTTCCTLADSVGVFQVESRAQQSMLPRMKPVCFYDIVMQVAIIRPGPIQGDMIHPFLRRRNGMEPVTYPHPKLKPVLERTLGVPLFQEQGMRMAIEAAGFSPGEADQLRRAMGHKRSRERMAEIYPRLIDGMVQNGIEREAAEQLFHMLRRFRRLRFPGIARRQLRAALVCLGLREMPRARRVLARRSSTCSRWAFTRPKCWSTTRAGTTSWCGRSKSTQASTGVLSIPKGALRLGFHVVRGLGEAQRSQLEAALAQGAFGDLADFAARTGLSKDALENLAIAGAFAPWFGSRREAMWALRALDERDRARRTGPRDGDRGRARSGLRTLDSARRDRLRPMVAPASRPERNRSRTSARSSTRTASSRPAA